MPVFRPKTISPALLALARAVLCGLLEFMALQRSRRPLQARHK